MNRRDIELLSAYLDGELKPSDSARLESRLKTDPELASVLSDLRATRTLLRKLPSRKAPRNFTLTRKMVGQNPPLPRTYPIFRFATAVATLLFFFSFGVNFMGTQLASQVPAFGMGGGGGAADTELYSAQEAPAAAAPAEEPSVALVPQGTEVPSSEDPARIMETPTAKDGATENSVSPDQPQVQEDALPSSEVQSRPLLVSSAWQIGLLVVAALSALLMGLLRQVSARRWK
jgi:anti-sigma factor RsiW